MIVEWIPVETPPKDMETVIICTDYGVVDMAFLEDKVWWINHAFVSIDRVTHWMPVPKPFKNSG